MLPFFPPCPSKRGKNVKKNHFVTPSTHPWRKELVLAIQKGAGGCHPTDRTKEKLKCKTTRTPKPAKGGKRRSHRQTKNKKKSKSTRKSGKRRCPKTQKTASPKKRRPNQFHKRRA